MNNIKCKYCGTTFSRRPTCPICGAPVNQEKVQQEKKQKFIIDTTDTRESMIPTYHFESKSSKLEKKRKKIVIGGIAIAIIVPLFLFTSLFILPKINAKESTVGKFFVSKDEKIYASTGYNEQEGSYQWWVFNEARKEWEHFNSFKKDTRVPLSISIDEEYDSFDDFMKNTNLTYPELNILTSRAWIDAGNHYPIDQAYYVCQDKVFYYLPNAESNNKAGWYMYKNGFWEWLATRDQKRIIGTELYYNCLNYQYGTDIKAIQRDQTLTLNEIPLLGFGEIAEDVNNEEKTNTKWIASYKTNTYYMTEEFVSPSSNDNYLTETAECFYLDVYQCWWQYQPEENNWRELTDDECGLDLKDKIINICEAENTAGVDNIEMFLTKYNIPFEKFVCHTSPAYIDKYGHLSPKEGYYFCNEQVYYFHLGCWYKYGKSSLDGEIRWSLFCHEDRKNMLGEDLWYRCVHYYQGESYDKLAGQMDMAHYAQKFGKEIEPFDPNRFY